MLPKQPFAPNPFRAYSVQDMFELEWMVHETASLTDCERKSCLRRIRYARWSIVQQSDIKTEVTGHPSQWERDTKALKLLLDHVDGRLRSACVRLIIDSGITLSTYCKSRLISLAS